MIHVLKFVFEGLTLGLVLLGIAGLDDFYNTKGGHDVIGIVMSLAVIGGLGLFCLTGWLLCVQVGGISWWG